MWPGRFTFASRGQHLIYWGPLKKPLEWSLKTFLAPWSYLASVTYANGTVSTYHYNNKHQLTRLTTTDADGNYLLSDL